MSLALRAVAALVLLLGQVAFPPAFGQDVSSGLTEWSRLSALPTLWAVAAGPDRIVTVGRQGSILTSADGLAWENVESGVGISLIDVTFDAGEFLAAGLSNTVLRSADARTWSRLDLPGTNDFLALSRQNGRFVVCGRRGALLTSRDGSAWTTVASGTQVGLNAVTQWGSTIVVVGEAGTILVSTNGGDSWRKAPPVTPSTLTGVKRFQDAFVVVGSANTILRSADGLVWKVLRAGGSPTFWDIVEYAGETFVAGSTEVALTSYGTLSRTTNFTAYTDRRLPTGFLHGLTEFRGALIGIGVGGLITRSEDAETWTVLRSTPADNVWRLTVSPGALWATVDAQQDLAKFGSSVGILDISGIFRSAEDQPWIAVPRTNTPALVRCVRDQGKWVGVGEGGLIWVSSDGLAWRSVDSGSRASLRHVMAGNGLFLAVGNLSDQGVILTSRDGEAWTSCSGIPKGILSSVAYGGGSFVAVGPSMLLVSTNGLTWEPATGIPPSYAWDVAYGNGRFVTTDFGRPLVSADGRSWKRAAVPENPLTSVAFGGGYFVAAGVAGTVMASTDGQNWQSLTRISTNTLRTVLWSADRFLVGGDGGVIARSGAVGPLPPQWIQVPAPVEIGTGAALILTGLAAAGGPVSYQWYKDGQPIPGATSPTLDLGNVTAAQNGYYSLGATSDSGAIRTPDQRVEVFAPGPLDHWEVVRLPTGAVELSRCAAGDGRFVATTIQGGLATSADGFHWTESPSPSTKRLTGVQREQARFFVLGEQGFLAYSSDGQAWVTADVPSDQTLRAVAYHDGTWVAIGDGGTTLTSSDSRSWQAQTSATTQSLLAVTWDGKGFTAVGEQGAIVSSADGQVWATEESGTTVALRSVASADGVVTAVGDDGVLLCRGRSGWQVPKDFPPVHRPFTSIAFWQGAFRVVGPTVSVSVQIGLSGTGSQVAAFGSTVLLTTNTFSALCLGPTNLYAVAGTALMVWDSATPWAALPIDGAASLRDIEVVSDRLVVVGDGGTVLVSSDGRDWRSVNSGVTASLAAVAARPGMGVIVGALQGGSPTILTSSNGTEWTVTPAAAATTNSLVAACAGPRRFLALDSNGGITTSEDGSHWQATTTPVGARFRQIASNAERFWALASGALWNSPDGLTWTSNRVAEAVSPEDLFADGTGVRFLAQGVMFHAPVGAEVEPRIAGWQPWSLRVAAVENARFAGLVGAAFPVLSLNGRDWYAGPSLQPWSPLALKSLRGAFYAVGTYGVILRSAPQARLSVRPGSVAELRLEAFDGRNYRVEYRDEVAGDGVWKPLDAEVPESAATGRPRWLDPGAAEATRRFYRGVLVP